MNLPGVGTVSTLVTLAYWLKLSHYHETPHIYCNYLVSHDAIKHMLPVPLVLTIVASKKTLQIEIILQKLFHGNSLKYF